MMYLLLDQHIPLKLAVDILVSISTRKTSVKLCLPYMASLPKLE